MDAVVLMYEYVLIELIEMAMDRPNEFLRLVIATHNVDSSAAPCLFAHKITNMCNNCFVMHSSPQFVARACVITACNSNGARYLYGGGDS